MTLHGLLDIALRTGKMSFMQSLFERLENSPELDT